MSEKRRSLRDRGVLFSRSMRSFTRRRSSLDSVDSTISSAADSSLSFGQQLLVDHIRDEKWDLFVKGTMNGTSLEELDKCFRSSTDFDDASILHYALRFDPPHSIVNKITKELPKSAYRKDCRGHTALHIAIMSKASKYVVGHLVKQNARSCEYKDTDGKIPLHRYFEGENDTFSIHIVESLIELSPSSLDIEDEDGMCPLESAIMSDAPLKIVELLQRAKRSYHQQLLQWKTSRPNGDLNCSVPSEFVPRCRISISSASA